MKAHERAEQSTMPMSYRASPESIAESIARDICGQRFTNQKTVRGSYENRIQTVFCRAPLIGDAEPESRSASDSSGDENQSLY